MSAISMLASINNETAPIAELSNYGSDFTDTDGDGMTDVAELRYGFDPNDKNSYPTKDYTILSENNRPELHKSTGVLDPKNEIRFEFTKSDYALNRKGQVNYAKLESDREFLNLAMPILLHELGAPPDSFFIEIRCQNRGVYANGYKISVNDDSPPSSFLHEIGHAWKLGWDYSWMNGKRRTYMRGFEEGFAEALVYHIQNRFVEAYPTHPLVKSRMVTSRNGQTWRGNAYDFDVTFGNKAFRGGTFHRDKFTEYRYENSSAVFTVIANQRDGAMKDILQSYYTKIEQNPSWDRTLNVNETFDVWESVLPTINGVDTKKWLNKVGLLNGSPAPQELYVSLIDKKVFVAFPDKSGNFSWSHSDPSSQNIPNWFPKKKSGSKFVPNVGNIKFDVSVKTINGEEVVSFSKQTASNTLGQTLLPEIYYNTLPIGLYSVNVEFPTFKSHTNDNKTNSYIMGGMHTINPKDVLNVHLGLDIPNVEDIELKIQGKSFTTEIINGLAMFRLNTGIDFTGPVDILVKSNNKTNTYKRVISHFGFPSGERVNQFVIVDKDFDNVEDKFDANITPIQSNSFTSYSEILANAETIANPLTELVTNSVEPTKPKPQLPNNPVTPPSVSNPILDLENRIKILEGNVTKLVLLKSNLETKIVEVTSNRDQLTDTVADLENQIADLSTQLKIVRIDLGNATASVNSVTHENVDLKLKIADLTKVNQNLSVEVNDLKNQIIDKDEENSQNVELLSQVIVDMNATINDLNNTIITLEGNNTNLVNAIATRDENITKLTNENTTLLAKIEALESQISKLENASSEYASVNQNLRESLDVATNDNQKLAEELNEAIRVAQVPFTSGWFFDPEDGWLYTDANSFPLIYKHNTESWYFYELGSHDSRFFYSFQTEKWEEWK